jgi:hypothetical protein
MIELRPDRKGNFDELVARKCDVHFEMMDGNTLWVSVRKGKMEYHLWISSKRKLKVGVSDES